MQFSISLVVEHNILRHCEDTSGSNQQRNKTRVNDLYEHFGDTAAKNTINGPILFPELGNEFGPINSISTRAAEWKFMITQM